MSQTRWLICLTALLSISFGCSRTPPAAAPSNTSSPREVLTLTYLGVAGYQIESGAVRVLSDPYFSRPADLEGIVRPDQAAIAAHAPDRADLIVVGHSHVDHLLDVPSVALMTQAQVMGSLSTARVARASGLPSDRIIPVKGGEDFAFEGYSVRVIPSLHSALNEKHTLGGEIPQDVQVPMPGSAYAEGGTLAYLLRLGGHEVLILSTANFIERELSGLRPDVAIVATGLRHEIHDYTCRLMRALGQPPLVYVNHFDDWRAAPVDTELSADLAAFVEEVRTCSPATKVVIPRHFVPYEVR
jgi:L-ascorbate metabolism protein UlaG (beta-lactamase superfamily)